LTRFEANENPPPPQPRAGPDQRPSSMVSTDVESKTDLKN